MDKITLCIVSEDELYPVADVITEQHPYWHYHKDHPERQLGIPTKIIKEWEIVNSRWEELNQIILTYKRKANKYAD